MAFQNTKYHTWSFTTWALVQSHITLSGMAQNVDTLRMDKMRIYVLSAWNRTMPWIMTSNGWSVPYVKIGFRNNAFCRVVVITWAFILTVAVILKGFCLVGWKTMKSTVDFHFFDIVNQTLCIAFLLNFWTLQRSFCISKLRFDTSIYSRFNFLRYLLDGNGNLFLQISLQPFDQ